MLTALNDEQTEQVSGGCTLVEGYPDPYLIDQLFAYQTGQPSIFGPNETYTPLPAE